MSPDNKQLLFLVGATAVGKTAVSLELAGRLGSEIINADSRQVYRGMDIGTSKPTQADQARVRHHLLDLVDPDDDFNVGIYKRLAEGVIARQHEGGRLPLVVGGTGLYLKALAYGLWTGPGADWGIRSRLLREQQRCGEGYLHRRLREVDPVSAARIHPRDTVKIIRALEVYELEGRPLSYFHEKHRFEERRWRVIWVGLRRGRKDLYQRIERRIDAMVAAGMIEEVKKLLARGSPGLPAARLPDGQGQAGRTPAMQGLGYRHLRDYLRGAASWEAALGRWKRDTKRFAKRQETWFRADPAIPWFDLGPEEPAERTAEKILNWLKAHHRLTRPFRHLSAPQPAGSGGGQVKRGGVCV
jgi:tRNA dimethylallyltransferase